MNYAFVYLDKIMFIPFFLSCITFFTLYLVRDYCVTKDKRHLIYGVFGAVIIFIIHRVYMLVSFTVKTCASEIGNLYNVLSPYETAIFVAFLIIGLLAGYASVLIESGVLFNHDKTSAR